jgi:Co/Zn/Cd efflux system component
VIEAIKRFIDKVDIKEVDLLLYVACIGLAINLIGLFIFGHGHSHGVSTTEQIGELTHDVELGKMNDELETDNKNTSQDTDDNDLQNTLVDRRLRKPIGARKNGASGKNNAEKKKAKCCSFLCKHRTIIDTSWVAQFLISYLFLKCFNLVKH